MSHQHVGPKDRLCPGCWRELEETLAREAVARRRWGLILLGFVVAVGLVCAFVLFEIATHK